MQNMPTQRSVLHLAMPVGLDRAAPLLQAGTWWYVVQQPRVQASPCRTASSTSQKADDDLILLLASS